MARSKMSKGVWSGFHLTDDQSEFWKSDWLKNDPQMSLSMGTASQFALSKRLLYQGQEANSLRKRPQLEPPCRGLKSICRMLELFLDE